MSSYGGGFAQGMESGARMANSWMDTYDRAQKNSAVSTLFNQGNIEGEKIRQQDMTNYNDQTASLFSGGYTPTAEEMGAIGQGATTMSEQKPSQLFSQSIMGMNSQERLGHMVTLAQQGGLKINNNTLETLGGVNSLFDNAQKQDMEFEAKQFNMAEAQRAQQQAIIAEQQRLQGRNTLGELTYQTFKDDEKYKGLFGSIAGAGEGADMSRFADAAPLLFRDSQSNDKLMNSLLLAQMNTGSREKIAEGNRDTRELIAGNANDTKQMVAAMRGSNTQFQYDNLDFKKQLAEEKRIEREAKLNQEKKQAGQKNFESRYKTADKMVPKDLKNPEDIHKWKSYFAATGQVPKKEGNVYKTDVSNYQPNSKSNPTKTAPRGDIIKQIKASYPNATQGQINAFLKQKGY